MTVFKPKQKIIKLNATSITAIEEKKAAIAANHKNSNSELMRTITKEKICNLYKRNP
jgi:hypothetical protein